MNMLIIDVQDTNELYCIDKDSIEFMKFTRERKYKHLVKCHLVTKTGEINIKIYIPEHLKDELSNNLPRVNIRIHAVMNVNTKQEVE